MDFFPFFHAGQTHTPNPHESVRNFPTLSLVI